MSVVSVIHGTKQKNYLNKVKFHSLTCHEGIDWGGARCEWLVSATPRPLYLRERDMLLIV
jgi:hypothetical protein